MPGLAYGSGGLGGVCLSTWLTLAGDGCSAQLASVCSFPFPLYQTLCSYPFQGGYGNWGGPLFCSQYRGSFFLLFLFGWLSPAAVLGERTRFLIPDF